MGQRIILVFALLIVTAAGVSGPAYGQTASDVAYVTRVVDGNVIYAAVGQRIEAIRYIGVGVPFIAHPVRGPEPYGALVAEINRQMVDAKWVRLRFDQQARDEHGRLLAYVWVDGVFVNATLLHRGYAEAERGTVNTRYASYFQSLEADARRARRGLWGYGDVLAYHRTRPAESTAAAGNVGGQAANVAGGRVFSSPNPITPSAVAAPSTLPAPSSSPASAGPAPPATRSSGGLGRSQSGTTYTPGMR
jgi:endonuclease YncB( thermonuclease family)